MSNTLFSIDDIERLGTRARRENATNLFNGMAQLDNNMPATRFEGLVREVVGSIEGDEHREADKRRADEGSLPTGYFSAMDSAGLLAGEHRVYGFLQAIRRTPNVRRAIDIGTGSSALLAIATAVFQQKTERIVAYEINEVAAECARRVIELCGFEDLIEVVADNALDVPVKEADLVVSETFHRGLGNELGAKIMQHYGEAAMHLLPAGASVYAGAFERFIGRPVQRFGVFDGYGQWRLSGNVDFRKKSPFVEGSFNYSAPFPLALFAWTSLYDEFGVELIPYKLDQISQAVDLGNLPASDEVLTNVQFAYAHSCGIPADTVRKTLTPQT